MTTAFHTDFADMIAELTRAGADFVVVGGFAVGAWGFVRATKDLDIFVRPSPENAPRVFRALAAFGAPMSDLTVADLAAPGIVFQVGVPPRRIDVLTAIDGVGFDEAIADCRFVQIGGAAVPFIGLAALLRNKQASGRIEDQRDVRELAKLHPGTAAIGDEAPKSARRPRRRR